MPTNLMYLKDQSVLFADDDNIARAQMTNVLEMIFKTVHSAKNGEEALDFYTQFKPNLIITDIKMPKIDGIGLVEYVRKVDYDTPIIMLTSFSEQNLLLNAANLSIDGYLVKPVELNQVTNAISKAMKRKNNLTHFVELSPNIFYDTNTYEAIKDGEIIPLGAKEQELLNLLLNSKNKTLAKEELETILWPLDVTSASSLKNLVLRIRKKLDEESIISVRGVGYRIGPKRNRKTSNENINPFA
jgi:two-component system, OmpR family, response regulator VanR